MASYASTFFAVRTAGPLAARPALPIYEKALYGDRTVASGHKPGIGSDFARLAPPNLTQVDTHVEPAHMAASGLLSRARAAAPAKIYDATARNWS